MVARKRRVKRTSKKKGTTYRRRASKTLVTATATIKRGRSNTSIKRKSRRKTTKRTLKRRGGRKIRK